MVELERIASNGWRGTVTERLGDWLLRASGGFTGRANSVLALGSPDVGLPSALDAVADFYRRNELPPLFQIPFVPGVPDPLTADLVADSWQVFNATSVMTAAIVDGANTYPPRGLGMVVHEDEPSAQWLSGYLYRGRPLPANAVTVLVNARQPTFLSLVDGSELLGVARGIVTDGWLGVTAVTVPERHRRRGVGSALMAELLRWGADRGAVGTYLQVDAANTAALAMYANGGFVEHHRYHYLRRG